MQNGAIHLCGGRYLYISEYNQVINACIKDMFREYADNLKVTVKEVEINKEAVRTNIRKLPQLIFEITENCNLRCKYCVYNDNYINQRELAPHHMDFETARKGLDYVFSFIKDRHNKQFTLGFYGGEPLMNVKTIEKVTAYGKRLFSGWDLGLNMTTNLTLLTAPILDFLVENDFSLLVSLDGNKQNHDAKRVFIDGKGTHDIVMRNLEKIKEKHNDYFEKKVSFSSVHSFDLPLKNLHDFFTGNDLIKDKWVRFNSVNTYNTDYYERYPYNQARLQKEIREVAERVVEKMCSEEKLIGYEKQVYKTFQAMDDFLGKRSTSPLAGACLFDSRLYLDARGRFHLCEKMNNTFSFGDVERGFDFKKMVTMVNHYTAVIKEHCQDCNIKFLCRRCYVNFAGNGEFKLDPEFCRNQRAAIKNNLERYIEYREKKVSPGKKRFHQYVIVEKGPVNSAVIDLLRGNLYQVENRVIAALEEGRYEEIPEFLASAREERLILDVDENTWIPYLETVRKEPGTGLTGIKEEETGIELHVDEGVDLGTVLEKFKQHTIYRVVFYGEKLPGISGPGIKIIKGKKDFNQCKARAQSNGGFEQFSPSSYLFNKMYNPCLGKRASVTGDGKVRPCIYSTIAVGDIAVDDVENILEKMKAYWTATKDKVKKCKDCELRYICFDCREIAYREEGDLFSAPPGCSYDPYKGTWNG